ncbi:MAG: alpha/beta fold hydrolase [Bifidobacterium mongoliense]
MSARWTTQDFPVGFQDLHPDRGVNFQMNRLYNFSNDREMLSELEDTAGSIRDYDDLARQLLRLGDEALAEKQTLRAALYFRGAEFAMPQDAVRRPQLRQQFITLSNAYYRIDDAQHHDIPYGDTTLSVYRYTCESPKATVVFLNGFDGYIEELTRVFLVFRDAGYDVIAFDGPGQGAVLEQDGTPMTPEWEKPTGAVLDYFGLNDVTVVGCSLGGCLALRAAAFEPRITRAICFDILPSLFESVLHVAPESLKRLLAAVLPRNVGRGFINRLVTKAAHDNLTVRWGLQQGMHVMGSPTPYDFLRSTLQFDTASFGHLIQQDVLLLAGEDDHYVPRGQLSAQINGLPHTRSLTARVFTAQEQASNHCQLGNIGLALDTMLDWMNSIDTSTKRLAFESGSRQE